MKLFDRWWKKLLWLGGIPVLLVALFVFWIWLKYPPFLVIMNPWLPPQMQFAGPVFHDVVGDLGGVPVTIPRHYISLVEYEGDPRWTKREGPVPKRTHQSKLTSFAIDFRWPDMASASTSDLMFERRNQSINKKMWLFFGVDAGPSYPTTKDYLNHLANTIGEHSPYKYETLSQKQYGLTVHTPIGVDPATRVPFKSKWGDKDFFVHRNASGHVDAYIECSNVQIPSASCSHRFSLAPGMKVAIDVLYRRGLLPEWQNIQQEVTKLVHSWVVAPDSDSASLPQH